MARKKKSPTEHYFLGLAAILGGIMIMVAFFMSGVVFGGM